MMKGITLKAIIKYLDFRGVPPEMRTLFQSMKTEHW